MLVLAGVRAQQSTDQEQMRLTRASFAATENSVNRVRDEVWREDTLRARKQNLPRVLASCANSALLSLRMPGVQDIN